MNASAMTTLASSKRSRGRSVTSTGASLAGTLAAMADDVAQVERVLQRRRAAVADVWALEDEVVLVGAGDLIHRPGRDDAAYPFEAHSAYYYLTDRNRPGGVLAFDPSEGWVD